VTKKTYDDTARAQLCRDLFAEFGTDVVTTKQVTEFTKAKGLPFPYFLAEGKHKAGWGKYRVNFGSTQVDDGVEIKTAVATAVQAAVSPIQDNTENLIPAKEPGYVPFGFFNDLVGILASKIFYPVYITGLSGNGKTYMAEQACAHAKREFIRTNITKETDENDMIGSYELVDGNTVWKDGPALIAMKRGAVLLMDETDYGSERLLCMQSILEGKGYYNKKRGEFIKPAQGFNIIATANTKGKGSDDGRFIGANVLNEAFLERFAITVEQEYPALEVERKILVKLFAELQTTPGMECDKFAANLAKWGELIRKSHADGAVEEVISTRRLTHIARAYSIFKNRRKAIELCLNRFDNEVKTVYLDFYSKIDQDLDKKIVEPVGPELVIPTGDKNINAHPFSKGSSPGTPATPAQTATQVNQSKNDALVAARKLAQEAAAQREAAIKAFSPPNQPAKPAASVPAPSAQGVWSFGDAKNIIDVSAKFSTVVRVVRDITHGDVDVMSHGLTSRVTAQQAMHAPANLLETIVAEHSMGRTV
jgi:MoxR-like ATPase